MLDEPTDLDAFWQETLAEARRVPAVLDVRPEPNDLAVLDAWDVTFAGFGGDPVRAWYTRPSHVDDSLPVVVEYTGYGRGRGLPMERLTWPAAGYAHLLMDTRGQGDQYGCGGDTPDPPAGMTLGGPGPITRGILEPRDYYYRRLVTDAVRATEAARVLPGADAGRVVVTGNSQGGGLALAVAGLVPDLAAAVVTAPLLCDIRQAVSRADAGPYTELITYLAVHRDADERVFHTLSYVDGALLARRACAPLHLGIGLRDNVCPPSTAYAAFDRYGETQAVRPDRVVHAYPFNGHEGGEAVHVRRQLQWVATLLA
jgi:cephalosporin-C deacetylase